MILFTSPESSKVESTFKAASINRSVVCKLPLEIFPPNWDLYKFDATEQACVLNCNFFTVLIFFLENSTSSKTRNMLLGYLVWITRIPKMIRCHRPATTSYNYLITKVKGPKCPLIHMLHKWSSMFSIERDKMSKTHVFFFLLKWNHLTSVANYLREGVSLGLATVCASLNISDWA